MDKVSKAGPELKLESSDVKILAMAQPIGVVVWGLSALVFFIVAWLGLKDPAISPGADPYLEDCDWYRFILTRGYNCAYRQSGVIPVGPSYQLLPREAFTTLKGQNENSADQIGPAAIAKSRTLSVEVDDQRFAVDTLHQSSDNLRLGAISTNGSVLVQKQSGWSVLSQNTRSITSVKSIDFSHLNSQISAFSPIALSDELQLVAFVDTNNDILIETLPDQNRIVRNAPVRVPSEHSVRVTHLEFIPSSDLLVSFDIDGNMLVWKLSETSAASLVASNSTDDLQEPIRGFSVSDTGAAFAYLRADGSAALWSLTPKMQLTHEIASSNTQSTTRQIRLSPDGRLMAFSEDDVVRIYDAERGLDLLIDTGNGSLLDFAFLDGGQRFVAVTDIEISVTELSTLGVDEAKLMDLSARGPVANAMVGTNGNLLLHFKEEENQGLILVRRLSRENETNYSQKVNGLKSLILSKDGNTLLVESIDVTQVVDLNSDGGNAVSFSLFEFSTRTQLGDVSSERVITGLSNRGNYVLGRVNEIPTVAYIERSAGNDSTPRTLNMDAELIFSPAEIRYFKGSVPTILATMGGTTINDTIYSATLEKHFAVGTRSKVWVASNVSSENAETGGDLSAEDIPDLRLKEAAQSGNGVQDNTSSSDPTTSYMPDLNWEQVNIDAINTEMELFSVSVVGDLIIAAGEKGYFVVSEDGGQSWQALQTAMLSPDTLSVYLSLLPGNVVQVIGSAMPIGNTISTLPQLYTARLKLDRPVSAQLKTLWVPVPIYAGFAMGAYVALALGFFCLLLSLYRWLHYRASRSAGGDIPVGAGTSDRAIGWNDIDVLGIHGLAVQLSRFLRNVQTRPPLVIGVSGGWGSGKTSLMNLLYEDLHRRDNSAVWFNAWHHQHEHHLLASLFEAIRMRAVPPFLSLHGVWFRARLVIPRFLDVFKKWLPFIVVVLTVLIVYFRGIDQVDYDELRRLKESLFAVLEADFKKLSLPWKVASIPAALVVVYGLYIKFMSVWSALPTKPNQILGKIGRLHSIGSFGDQLSFRHKFGREFSQVCSALQTPGRPGLVIFIDDLDRCDGPTTLTILEAINYLVSEGNCIVVLGFDRSQVEHSIGTELKAFAENADLTLPLHLSETDDHDPEKIQKNRQQAYARYYLEKLINIDVTVPALTREGALALAEAENEPTTAIGVLTEKDQKWLEHTRPTLLRYIYITKSIVSAGFIFILIVLPLYYASERLTSFYNNSEHLVTIGQTEEKIVSIEDNNFEANSRAGAEEPSEQTVAVSIPSEHQSNIVWPQVAVFESTNIDGAVSRKHHRFEYIILVPISLAFILLAFVYFLRRILTLKGEVEFDPPSFTAAMQSANQVVQELNGTPRSIKRFMNKMRFASIRFREVNYPPMGIDRLAKWFKLVEKNFHNKAYKEPLFNDDKLIAIGALETYLNGFDGQAYITDIEAEFQRKRNSHPSFPQPPETLRRILKSTDCTADDVNAYIRTFYGALKKDR